MPDPTLEDRALIRELYGRYALAAAQQDGETWIGCWSESATWKTSHFEISGHEALRQAWAGTWSSFSSVAAFNEVGMITVNGDEAFAVSTVLELLSPVGGGVTTMAGLYTDKFAREDGAWRFARRDYALICQTGGQAA